ncbi:ABC transporter permease [Microbacterium sp. LRZ72]|uniref:ABC transporter permease n=1 Tax=Microbacterium sp. LRZ72 TaxID=2942481 RepID=UPI0029A62533|nr:ABC transporter permease [Microbacterium sp. LRZ72]MDX2377524.1 ABC transporter permease [Microbacterium sp. LRZ72]
MLKLIGYRLALAVPQLLVISLLIFLLTYMVPGSVAAAILGEAAATPAAIAAVEEQLGLNRPLVERLGDYYAGLFQGDLGTSLLSNQDVSTLIAARLPATLSLVGSGLLFAVLFGVSAGLFAGVRAGQVRDRAVTGVTAVIQSIPEFWVGLILVLVFVITLGWFPVVAWTPPDVNAAAWLRGLILPAVALGAGAFALIARQTRTAIAEALASRYVDTLTAAGVSRRRVVWKYALKNAMVPVLAASGLAVSILIGTSLVMERVFSFPGLGTLMLGSVLGKDFPVVQGVALVIAIIVISVNLVIDILYGVINPKARPA